MISTWPFWIWTCLNKSRRALFLFFFGCLCALPSTGHTQQFLSFNDASNYKEQKALSFIKEIAQTPDLKYSLSTVDLNSDALDEYVIRPQNCAQKQLCPHWIVAFMRDDPILLLSASARQIIVLHTHKFGVKDLEIYQNPLNDFESKLYQWNPYQYVYEQKLREY